VNWPALKGVTAEPAVVVRGQPRFTVARLTGVDIPVGTKHHVSVECHPVFSYVFAPFILREPQDEREDGSFDSETLCLTQN
jgi:hypothetical protein